MKKTLQEYALLAEIIGAFAVVFSLIYVGYQVQTNTAEQRVESVQSITTGYRELALVYVNNEDAGIAWHKVLDGEELTKRELDLMSDSIYSHLMTLEEAYDKYREGYINEEFLNARVALMQQKILLSPQIRNSYESMKIGGIFTRSFVEWLDVELKKSNLYDDPQRTKSYRDLE
ncbi:MAG: hypothetical protein HOI35_10990 [Woeseia sp.]|nr:hypothetical protein [Woeseia sp.]MBT6210530.1 hypothetical protein [Woeseia sp.]